MTQATRGYRDLHEHLQALEERGLLRTIDRPIDKDSELHPLVRWQFVGGMDEASRKAFLFNNIVDALGRKYDMPVVVGAIAANPAIYSIGMDAKLEDIQAKWDQAIANPVEPRLVNEAICHEVVIEGKALQGEGHGLDTLPIPVSTPGFDSAPTLTATNVITRDPETGVQNMGTYRAALKAPDRLVVRMATRVGGAGGYQHYLKYQKRGEPMPCAIVLGCPPYVAFMGPQKLPLGVDEFTVAGGLAGEPINVVRARTVDLLVPAESELVIEGLIDTVWLEPEAPFGESHGHVALEEFNMPMQVTAITHRKKPVIPSYISQVAPSESSVIKRVAYEPLYLSHLRNTLGIRGVKRVQLHEPLTGLLRLLVVTVEKGLSRTEIWRALRGAAFFKADTGKICIAVNDDISADNANALFWAMAYRMNPVEDLQVVPHRGQGHGPKREHDDEEDSTLLMDATMKGDMPPLALPKQEYMERAHKIWDELGFEPLRPQPPWFGYSLGDWLPQWDEAAKRAALGRYLENGLISAKQKRKGLKPETKFRPGEDGGNGNGKGKGKAKAERMAETLEELSFTYFPDNYRWSHGLLIGLNMAPWGGAEIGEINRIGLRLKKHVGDDDAWFREWSREARVVEDTGRARISQGHSTSGAKYLQRASAYYHVGERFLQPKSQAGNDAYMRGVHCLRDAAKYLKRPRLEHVEIPYDGRSLPAIYVHAEPANRSGKVPAMVFFDGLDVTKEIQYFKGVADLVARGIACLIVDGPGNGESIRFRNMYLRPDTEHYATPVFDYLSRRPEVDPKRIGVMAISLGGYYAPRAAAFEQRFACAIAWGAQWDYRKIWADRFERIARADTPSLSVAWQHIAWVLNATSQDDVLKKLEPFKLDGVVQKIKCPFLMLHGEGDEQIPLPEAQKCFDAVGSKQKTFKLFTREEGGYHHCQIDNQSICSAYMWDWLEQMLQPAR